MYLQSLSQTPNSASVTAGASGGEKGEHQALAGGPVTGVCVTVGVRAASREKHVCVYVCVCLHVDG